MIKTIIIQSLRTSANVLLVLIVIPALNLLLAQSLWCRLFSSKLYKRCNRFVIKQSVRLCTLVTRMGGGIIIEQGDDPFGEWDGKGKYLLLSNHRSMMDWALLSTVFANHGEETGMMWIVGYFFQFQPFGGLVRSMGAALLKGRKYGSVNYLKEFCQNNFRKDGKYLVMYPEGHIFCVESNRERNAQYAEKMGLKPLQQTLYPRFLGMKAILDVMAANNHREETDKIKYVVDVVMAHPVPAFTIRDWSLSFWPSEPFYFHYRIYRIEEVPRDEDALRNWLYDRFAEKEKMLITYAQTGILPNDPTTHEPEHMPHFIKRMPKKTLQLPMWKSLAAVLFWILYHLSMIVLFIYLIRWYGALKTIGGLMSWGIVTFVGWWFSSYLKKVKEAIVNTMTLKMVAAAVCVAGGFVAMIQCAAQYDKELKECYEEVTLAKNRYEDENRLAMAYNMIISRIPLASFMRVSVPEFEPPTCQTPPITTFVRKWDSVIRGKWVEFGLEEAKKWVEFSLEEAKKWVEFSLEEGKKWGEFSLEEAKKWVEFSLEEGKKWGEFTLKEAVNLLNRAEREGIQLKLWAGATVGLALAVYSLWMFGIVMQNLQEIIRGKKKQTDFLEVNSVERTDKDEDEKGSKEQNEEKNENEKKKENQEVNEEK